MIPSTRLVLLVAASSPLWFLAAIAPQALPIPVAYVCVLIAFCLAGYLATPGAKRISVRRALPFRFSLDSEQEVRLTLSNHSRRRISVELRDDVPDALVLREAVPPFGMEPGETKEVGYTVRAARRGAVGFRWVSCRIGHGAALIKRQIRVVEQSKGKVYPCFMGVDRFNLLAVMDRREESSRTPRTAKGQGSDFESLRPYVPGDDLRRMEWKVSAKRGTLITRNMQVERGQQLAILIDAGRFMTEPLGTRSRFEHAVGAAVMLASVAQKRGDAVSLACFSNRIESFMPTIRGSAILPRVLDALADVQPRAVESDYWHAFAGIVSRLHKRSLIVLMSEVLDRAGSSGLINNMVRSARKHLILCVVLSNRNLADAAEQIPEDLGQSYRKAAASHVALERVLALHDMRSKGIMVLETDPEHFSLHLVNKYLEIRRANLL